MCICSLTMCVIMFMLYIFMLAFLFLTIIPRQCAIVLKNFLSLQGLLPACSTKPLL